MQIHSVCSECEDGCIEVGVRIKENSLRPGWLCLTRCQFVEYDRTNHEVMTGIENELLEALIPTLKQLGIDS
jgi:hypothetical protein